MTLTRDTPVRPAPLAAEPPAVAPAGWTDRRVLAGVLGVLGAMYALLLNPYWTPGGDSELFVAVARSIVRGEGYVYNGQPVTITPPGWPAALAGLLWVSPTFLFLKVALGAMMLAAMGLTYRVVRRFAPPARAGVVVLLTGSLVWTYSLTMWLHTEAFFLLVASGAMLLACRVSEGRGGAWGVAGVVALSAIMVLTRWPGLFQFPILAALLVGPRWRPARDRRWLAVALVLAAMLGTFAATRAGVTAYADRKMSIEPETGVATLEDGTTLAADEVGIETDSIADSAAPRATAEKGVPRQYAERAIGAGHWFAWLLWQPLRFGQAVAALDWLSLAVGWSTIGLLAAATIGGWRRGQAVWIGVAAYCGFLVVTWPAPNARYFVPVAPFVVLGAFSGLESLARRLRWGPRAAARLTGALAASVLMTNGALYAVDVAVARGGDYYGAYWGGLHRNLVSASAYLRARGVDDRDVVVSERYHNMGRASYEPFGTRSAAMLLDRVVRRMDPRDKQLSKSPNTHVRTWARRRRVDFYLYQQNVDPWVVWHFRLPAWLQARLGAPSGEGPSGGWVLYEMVSRDGRTFFEPIDVPDSRDWPTRVPGL